MSPDPRALATALAAVHRSGEAREGPRLIDYAESPRVDDWTLRSALVRVAQPEPVRAGAVLELLRRTDGALAPHRRRLDRDLVPTLPTLTPEAPDPGRAPVEDRVWDARTADLARVSVRFAGGDEVVAAYAAAEGLDDDEAALVPLLRPAVELDSLADVLAAWAAERPGPPPVERIDRSCSAVYSMLAAAGVPREDSRGLKGGRRG